MTDPSTTPLPGLDPRASFDWRDGERRIAFGRGAHADAIELIAELGGRYAVLCSPRAAATLPAGLAAGAERVVELGAGPVAELTAPLVDSELPELIVAYGGGRLIDSAKAIVAARGGGAAVALPTTLSGAEMTAVHRMPDGHSGTMVRPALVVWDPGALESAPEATLRASAMNAAGHAAEALWVRIATPLSSLAALEGIRLVVAGLEPPRGHGLGHDELGLGALLCGYALDQTALSFHHVVSQSLVHTIGSPHAETNAVVLPLAVEAMAGRAPRAVAAIAAALGVTGGGAEAVAARLRRLAGAAEDAGVAGLRTQASEPGRAADAVAAILGRSRQLGLVADPPGEAELEALVAAAIDGPESAAADLI